MELFTYRVLTQTEDATERLYAVELLVGPKPVALLAEVEYRSGRESWSAEPELQIYLRLGTACCHAERHHALLDRSKLEGLLEQEPSFLPFDELELGLLDSDDTTLAELQRVVPYCGECGLVLANDDEIESEEVLTWLQDGGSLASLPRRYPEDPSHVLALWLGLDREEPLAAQLFLRELEDGLDEFFAEFRAQRELSLVVTDSA